MTAPARPERASGGTAMQRVVVVWVSIALIIAGAALGSGQAVSVMPLGDSITAGTTPGCYRKPMVAKLGGSYGLTVTTVGTQSDQTMDAGQQAHEGHGG